MDPEQTFIRVQERFSQILTPKVRAALEYMYLFIAITLFCILVVMHANYVQQVSLFPYFLSSHTFLFQFMLLLGFCNSNFQIELHLGYECMAICAWICISKLLVLGFWSNRARDL